MITKFKGSEQNIFASRMTLGELFVHYPSMSKWLLATFNFFDIGKLLPEWWVKCWSEILTFLYWWTWELWRCPQTTVLQTAPRTSTASSESICPDAHRRTLARELEVGRMDNEGLW